MQDSSENVSYSKHRLELKHSELQIFELKQLN